MTDAGSRLGRDAALDAVDDLRTATPPASSAIGSPHPPRPRASEVSSLVAVVAVLVVAAFLLRLAVAADLSSLAIQHRPVLDERVHDQLALEILSSGWRPERPFFKAPLYPYFLASCYAAFGHSMNAVRVVQSAIGALTVALVAWIGWRVAGRAGSLTSAALFAFYAQTTFYAALLMKATLVVFFMALFVICAVGERPGRSRCLPFLSGVFLGVASLLRGNLLILLPVLVVWRWLRSRPLGSPPLPVARSIAAALPAFGLAVVVLPFTLMNYLASEEVVLTESTAGITFYIGNRQGASGLYEPLYPVRQGPNFEEIDGRRMAAEIASERRGAVVTEAEVTSAEASRILGRETLRDIAEQPAGWLRLLSRKLLLFWNAYETPTGNSVEVYAESTPWLRWNPVTFGTVAPLGLLGLGVLFYERRHRVLLVVVLGVCLSVVAFFVMERFRFAMLPALVGAVYPGVDAMIRAIAARDHRRLLVLAAGLGSCALLVHLPLYSESDRAGDRAIAHYQFGRAESELSQSQLVAGRPVEGLQRNVAAERHLVRARELDSDLLPAQVELAVVLLRRGTVLLRAGRPVEAQDSYRRARETMREVAAHPTAPAYGELLEQARRDVMALLERNERMAAAAVAARPRSSPQAPSP